MDRFELKQLIRRCEAMEYGVPRLKAALHALSLAEEVGDPWCLISSNYFVACSYLMSDDAAKALPYCAEYFQLLEQNPAIKPGAVFELYLAKSAVIIALRQPQISTQQGKALLDQFEARCKHYNTGWHHFHRTEFLFYLEIGMLERAAESFERFRVDRPAEGWDCEGCRVGSIASALLEFGRTEEALAMAQPLLAGALTCDHGSQPSDILEELLEYDLEHGDLERAAQWAAQLTRMGFHDRGDWDVLSTCLLYCALTDPERSLGMLEKGITWSIGQLDAEDLFDFYRAAWATCAVLGKQHQQLTLQLPKRFVRYQEEGVYDTQALANWFYGKAVGIGQKFDRRNGTQRYAQKLQWVEKGMGFR